MWDDMEIKIVRSRRKTISMQILGGDLIVKVPRYLSRSEIQSFLQKHRQWIEKHARKAETAQPPLSAEELQKLTEQAKSVFSERVAFYAPMVGVTYGRISIRHQRTRWGSCSAAGNLNFNCLLMLAPPEVLDSVVVHELCHRKEMNHSRRFYEEVLRVFPEYEKWHRWLKDNGTSLMSRLPQDNKK